MIWVLKNQLGRRNLSNTQFEIMVGKEYELQKKIGRGGWRSKSWKGKSKVSKWYIDRPERTRDRIALEHSISPNTVARSANLYNSLKAIQEVAPEIARKLESEEIKASKKDIRTLRKVLKQGTLEHKEQIVSELKKDDFKNAIETAKEIEAQSKPKSVSPETEAPLDDRVGDIIANPEVSPTRSNSDLDVFLMLADRIY